MNKLQILKDIILSENNKWEEKETTPELFQYNSYMRFIEILDIDELSFNNKMYNKIEKIKNEHTQQLYNIVLSNLEKKYSSYVTKCSFVKLLPQRYPSRQYYESEAYESVVSKIYIPIIINEKNSFCINDQILDPYPGQELFAKSDDLVAIYNFGNTEIIYLSIDLISDSYFS
jgi:hypothetical protein